MAFGPDRVPHKPFVVLTGLEGSDGPTLPGMRPKYQLSMVLARRPAQFCAYSVFSVAFGEDAVGLFEQAQAVDGVDKTRRPHDFAYFAPLQVPAYRGRIAPKRCSVDYGAFPNPEWRIPVRDILTKS